MIYQRGCLRASSFFTFQGIDNFYFYVMSDRGQAYAWVGVMRLNCAWKELLAVLPPWIRRETDIIGKNTLQEIRLRRGLEPVLIKSNGRSLIEGKVTGEDIHYVINMACRYSPWTVPTTAQGFITISGGHRIGLCGDVLIRNGRMEGIRAVTSLNIRICRDFSGIGSPLGGYGESILIIGPPGSGKTTLLRDLIRQYSHQENVAVVDERGEIFPTAAYFPTGENTDVITGCNKKQGMEMLLRVMGPGWIAVDEITAAEDCDALLQAGKCGVKLLATAHATSVADLNSRPIYRRLLESGIFERVVILQMDKSWRTERMCV